jgi:hypothetical protein
MQHPVELSDLHEMYILLALRRRAKLAAVTACPSTHFGDCVSGAEDIVISIANDGPQGLSIWQKMNIPYVIMYQVFCSMHQKIIWQKRGKVWQKRQKVLEKTKKTYYFLKYISKSVWTYF